MLYIHQTKLAASALIILCCSTPADVNTLLPLWRTMLHVKLDILWARSSCDAAPLQMSKALPLWRTMLHVKLDILWARLEICFSSSFIPGDR